MKEKRFYLLLMSCLPLNAINSNYNFLFFYLIVFSFHGCDVSLLADIGNFIYNNNNNNNKTKKDTEKEYKREKKQEEHKSQFLTTIQKTE